MPQTALIRLFKPKNWAQIQILSSRQIGQREGIAPSQRQHLVRKNTVDPLARQAGQQPINGIRKRPATVFL